jgi:arylsulfatase A-like enzyme
MPSSDQGVSRRVFVGGVAASAVAGAATAMNPDPAWGTPDRSARPAPAPNIVLVQADDLGYGELGCYWKREIRTPHIDALAASGQRFTQNYCGAPLCSPSRYSLLTGQHTGHAAIRNNSGEMRPDDITVADVLRGAGYVTGLIGKWGLNGSPGTPTWPTGKGFDEFYGYSTNTSAHDYYPSQLWRNDELVSIPENAGDAQVSFAPDLLTDACLDFIRRHRNDSFFLYYNPNVPHAPNVAPTAAPYDRKPWPDGEKYHAAQVTRTDEAVGRLVRQLRAMGLEDNTIVIFTSDNGPHEEGGQAIYDKWGAGPHDPRFFNASGGLRGIKRNVYEGGIRIPMVVRTPVPVIARLRAQHGRHGTPPGRIPGSVSHQVWTHWDLLPTFADIAGVAAPETTDGISFLPTLLGLRQREEHDYLYWEAHAAVGPASYPVTAAANSPADPLAHPVQAIRIGDWKAVRREFKPPIELYDLRSDPGETTDVADSKPRLVAAISALFATSRTPYREDPQPVSIETQVAPPAVDPGSSATVTMTLTNQRADAFAGVVRLQPSDGWSTSPDSRLITLPASVGARQEVVFTITAPAEPTDRILGYTVESQGAVVASGTVGLSGVNLARTAVATASSTHANWDPAGAIDGVRSQSAWPNTGWNDGTSGQFPDWLQLTWDQPQSISTVELVTRPTGKGLKDYDIQVPANGSWATVAEVRGNTGEVIRTTFATATTTALRIYATASASGDYSRIVELEVYG